MTAAQCIARRKQAKLDIRYKYRRKSATARDHKLKLMLQKQRDIMLRKGMKK